ncbi:MAG: hypothetical protein ACXWR1_08185 [Bdellovibrionota bacterium]
MKTPKSARAATKAILYCSILILPPLAMAADSAPVNISPKLMATVFNLTRVKIMESNNVTLRPGSLYDNMTYFESLGEVPQPGYNYEFIDSGLGAAEPLYPMYQKGHQGSYLQLVPAYFSNRSRHIDHFSSLETAEHCRVDGIYLLRDLSEYPATMFQKERAEGFTQTVVKLDYYTKLTPDAQCGRHLANDPDPSFDPMAYMTAHHDAMSLADFPAKELPRFEAKMSAIYQIVEEMSPRRGRFDLDSLKVNSLWYYPNGHAADYGVNRAVPLAGLDSFQLPEQMRVDAPVSIQSAYPLNAMLKDQEFQKVLNFWNGKPTPDFDPAKEPGQDTLRLSDVTPKNIYTGGLSIENIQDVAADVSNPKNFKMVAMTLKPYEKQLDSAWEGERVVPQVRFVFQMMNPRDPSKPVEQLFLHLKWDAVDRLGDDKTRNAQHRYFLTRADQLTKSRETHDPAYEKVLSKFIAEFTHARPIETIAFSSSLTGMWIFGNLGRDQNPGRELQANKIIRQGIDFGYYSSTKDNDLVRAEIKLAHGERKIELLSFMDDLTVTSFRDSRRQDPHAISFNRVSCAQCHQTSGRDGVHMSFNDGLNRSITSPSIVSEYFFHDAQLQLEGGPAFWAKQNTP